ncbi:MAG: outer membrane beta-barrel protein [Chitinophagaceae bacterium]|nr:outer membrane beta-barrel protein [Chitinophagaceae bacterium]
MRNLFGCALFLCFAATSFAQNNGSIRGNLVDTALKQSIPDVTITILHANDSSLVTFGRSDKTGFFNIRYLSKGNYRLLATHIGYRHYSKYFEITDDKKEIDAGFISLNNKTSFLEEVTINREKPPVVFKNDTIEFNAGSFKTKPNSVVEDLLKKLPGVQVDKDGKIKANGEEVKKILVDGKEFFGNDPKVASKNLPADAIEKVQVFDKKSDQSQFTGFDDGNSEKTINLTLKPDKKNGLFGRASAGGGTKDRYQGNFNLNSFKGERQVSALGMANNTNKQGFSFLDMLNFTGGLGGPGGRGGGMVEMNNAGLPLQGLDNANNTITTTWAGGINFNDNWTKNLLVNGSYFYSRLQDAIEQKSNRKYLLKNNSFTRIQAAVINKENQNHRFNIATDYTIDSSNSIKLTSTANIQNSASNSNSIYNSISDRGYTLNNGYASVQSKSDGYNWNNNLLWRHKFSRKGRTVSANFNLGLNNAENDVLLQSQNSYFNPDGSKNLSDTLDQLSDQKNEGVNYGISLSYTEPLSKKSLLEANYNFNRNSSLSDKQTFDVDKVTRKYGLLNDMLSSDFNNQYDYHRGGLNWRYQQKKFNFSVGSSIQRASLESQFHFLGDDSMIRRSFVNLLPNARMQYNINKFKNFRFSYNTYTRQPNAVQLNPIIDNSDPLNIRIGNADLDQEYNHRLQFNYMSFDPFRRTSFFSMINFTGKQNSIVNDDRFNSQGVRTSRSVNAKGMYTLTGTLSWGLPVRKIKSNLNLNTDFSQQRSMNFINGMRNNILNRSLTQQVNLNFVQKDLLDITAGFNLSYNNVQYSIASEQNTNYWNQEYTLDANIYLPRGFSIASEFTFTRNTGYANGFNTNIALWNGGLAKQLFRNKKGEIKLQLFDILNQNAGVSRNANQNYIENVYSKILNRYLLVSFTYNISRFAGKGAPVQKGGNIRVVGERSRM